MKKLIIAAVLLGGGYYMLKKHLDMEDATLSEVSEQLKEHASGPVRRAQENSAALQEAQEARMRDVEDAAAR